MHGFLFRLGLSLSVGFVACGFGAPAGENQRLLQDLKPLPAEQPRDLLQDLKPHPEQMAKDIIRGSKQLGSRGLKDYLEILPTDFAIALSQLTRGQRLLDSGAGEAYFAEQYLAAKEDTDPGRSLGPKAAKYFERVLKTSTKERAHVTAIDLEVKRENIPSFDGKLRVLSGRFFEEIPNDEIGEVHLICDLFGVFAYSPHIDEVLRKYVSLLNRQGALYVFLGFNNDESFAFQSTVRLKNGNRIPLAEWIEKLPGLETSILHGSGSLIGMRSNLTLRIKVADRDQVQIPELALKEIHDHVNAPPVRNYIEK